MYTAFPLAPNTFLDLMTGQDLDGSEGNFGVGDSSHFVSLSKLLAGSNGHMAAIYDKSMINLLLFGNLGFNMPYMELLGLIYSIFQVFFLQKDKALPKTNMEPQNDEFQKGSPFQTRVPILGEPTMSFRECTSIRCLAPTKNSLSLLYRGMGSCTFQYIYI